MTSSRRVFVVDDDSSARNGLVRLFRTAGHDVRGFDSAEGFLEEGSPNDADCLVLDARMPGMSGAELFEELRQRGVRIPIIVISADDDASVRGAALRINATAFFRKPVDGAALLDSIDWAMSSTATQSSTNETGHS